MSRCTARLSRPALLASFLLLFAGIAPASTAAAASIERALGVRELNFRARSTDSLVRLPDRFILRGSDSVWADSRLLRAEADYLVLDGPSRLLWLHPPADSTRMRVRYRYLPVALADFYQHPAVWSPASSSEPRPAAGNASALPIANPPLEPGAGFGKFSISGSKTLSFEVATSRDVAVKQSLDLSLGGEIGREVSVVAILSDRNLPLTPEGRTQELSNLDKVVVEVKSAGYGASLGDYDLLLDAGEYASVARTVQGARGNARLGGASFEVAAALSKGEFLSKQFLGEEGRQGPYLLTDRAGRADVPVVAGSEQVWLDGERMKRGDNSDYTVDYGRGTLTFTSRRPIHPGSRIAVDYQFTADQFRRSLVMARSDRQWSQGTGLHVAWLREADDPSRPVGANLTGEDLDSLRNAAPGSVVKTSGAHFLGTGKGDYRLLRSGTPEQHFQYVGRDSGEYQVDFMLAGAGGGSYSDSIVAGGLAFAWRGSGKGAYVPGRLLPVPGSQAIADLGGSIRSGDLRLMGEGAVSLAQGNVLRDAPSERGSAWNVQGIWSPGSGLSGGKPGRIELDLRARRQENRFQPPGRTLAPFAEEDWNLAAADRALGRTVLTGALRYRPDARTLVGVELGSWNSSSRRDARRAVYSLDRDGALALRGRWHRISNTDSAGAGPGSGSRRRGNLSISLTSGAWRPEAHWDHDRAVGALGSVRQGYDDYGLGARWTGSAGLGAEAFQSWREDRLAASLVGAAPVRASTQRFSLNYAGSPDFSFQSTVAQRTVLGVGDSLGASRNAQLQILVRRGAAEGEAHYEIGATRFQGSARQISFVGSGLGAYDSLGNYVGRGDYSVHIFSGADLGATNQVSLNARLELSGERSGREGWLRRLVSRTETQSTQSARRIGGSSAFAWPGSLVDDPNVLLGNAVFRQDLEWTDGNGHGSVRVRHEWVGDADRQSPSYIQLKSLRAESARVRLLGAGGTSAEMELQLRRRRLQLGPAERAAGYVSRGVDSHANFKWAPSASVSVAALGRWLSEHSDDGLSVSRQIEAGPSVAVSRGGSFRVELRANRVVVKEEGPIQPGFSNYGSFLRSRFEHDVNVTCQIRSALQASLFAHGVHPDGGRLTENARIEMRATF